MTEVSRYTRNLTGPANRQPDRARLTHCLKFWGVRPAIQNWIKDRRLHCTGKSTRLCYQPLEKLWDYYEAAQQARTRMIARCHPDRGGDESTAALVNAMWDRTRLLFSRIGIGDQEKPVARLVAAFTRLAKQETKSKSETE